MAKSLIMIIYHEWSKNSLIMLNVKINNNSNVDKERRKII